MASGATGAGAAASVVEAVDITRKLTLYKRVKSEVARMATIDEVNALIGDIVSVRGAPAGARCNFQVENSVDRVSLSVTGDDFYIQQAVRLSRAGHWARTLRIAEEISVRAIPTREEMAAILTTDGNRLPPANSPNMRRPHNRRLTRRLPSLDVRLGNVSRLAANNPQLRLANIARLTAEERQTARLAGRRPMRRQMNAEMMGRELATSERQTRRNVRAALGRAQLSSSSSSNN